MQRFAIISAIVFFCGCLSESPKYSEVSYFLDSMIMVSHTNELCRIEKDSVINSFAFFANSETEFLGNLSDSILITFFRVQNLISDADFSKYVRQLYDNYPIENVDGIYSLDSVFNPQKNKVYMLESLINSPKVSLYRLERFQLSSNGIICVSYHDYSKRNSHKKENAKSVINSVFLLK